MDNEPTILNFILKDNEMTTTESQEKIQDLFFADKPDIQALCRICLSIDNGEMYPLLSSKEMLCEMFFSLTSIKVRLDEGLPTHICEHCQKEVVRCCNFKNKCLESDCKLRSYSCSLSKLDSLAEHQDFGNRNVALLKTLNNIKSEEDRIIEDIEYLDETYEHDESVQNIENCDNLTKLNSHNDDQDFGSGDVRSLNDFKPEGDGNNEDNKYLDETCENDDSVQNIENCDKTNELPDTIERHTDTHIKQLPKKRHLRCPKPQCAKIFTNLENLRAHTRSQHWEHDNPFPCPVCKDSFTSEHDLKIHSSLHSVSRPWLCNECSKEFKERSLLRRHLYRHMDKKRYKCSCGREFAERYALKRHTRVHSGMPVEKRHQCHLCDKRYKRLQCHPCDKWYSEPSLLSAHMARHNDERPFVCSRCGRGFTNARLLASHRLVHSSDKPHACHYCDIRFRHESTRNTHHRTHTGERPYVCAQCGKTFIQSSNLTLHMRTHSGEKPYVCSSCGRGFSSSSSLKSHVRTHTGAKPYACPDCGKKFSRLDMRRAHQRQHSSGGGGGGAGGSPRPHRCGVCARSFLTAPRLRDHYRTHTGEKPFECDMCQYKFATKSHLSKHTKMHRQKRTSHKTKSIVKNSNTNQELRHIDECSYVVLDTGVSEVVMSEEIIVQHDGEVQTDLLIVDDSQNPEYQEAVTFEEVRSDVSIQESSDGYSMPSEGRVKLYQLNRSVVQIHTWESK